jgi:putative cell wall-binding protein
MTNEKASESVDAAIVNNYLPKLYSLIDRLLDGNPDKALIIEARRVLPSNYKNSFEKPKEKP